MSLSLSLPTGDTRLRPDRLTAVAPGRPGVGCQTTKDQEAACKYSQAAPPKLTEERELLTNEETVLPETKRNEDILKNRFLTVQTEKAQIKPGEKILNVNNF